MKKILLIEDNKEISDSIKQYLELEDFDVSRAFDWESWLDKAMQSKYDLVLLDLMLAKIDGITIARKIKQKSDIPIIMITAKDSLSDKLTWFENGAIDYIVKPFDLRELEARIKAHLKIDNSSFLIKFADMEINLEKREFLKSQKNIKITNKEFLIFDFLYKNKERVCSRTDIIEYVWWEENLYDGDAKLDVYISTLRRKLDKSIIETIKWTWYKFWKT